MGPVDLLVSFCNIGQDNFRFSLGLFHCDGQAFREIGFIDLKPILRNRRAIMGATGLCRFGDTIFVGLQGTPPALLSFGGAGAPTTRDLRLVKRLHSLVGHDGRLYIVSTGSDSVVVYDPRSGEETIVFQIGEGEANTLHVNGIAVHEGRLVVSLMGPIRPDGPRLGELRCLHTGRVLLNGLRSPHSVVSHGADLFVLESETGVLWRSRDGSQAESEASFVGYARGLHVAADGYIVGRSGFRNKSASLNFDRPRPQGFDDGASAEASRSGLYLMRRGGESVTALELTDLAPEIYDILALAPAERDSFAATLVPSALLEVRRALNRNDADAARAAGARAQGAARVEAELEVAEYASDLDTAIRLARRLAEADEEDVVARARLARLYSTARDLETALRYAREAAERQPADATLQNQRAWLARRLGRLDEAVIAYRQALASASNGASVRMSLAETLQEQGAREEAIGMAREVLTAGVAMRERLRAVEVLRMCGAADLARAELVKGMVSHGTNAEAHYQLSRIEVEERSLENGLAAARAAAELRPGDPKYTLNLADLLARLGMIDESRAILAPLNAHRNAHVAKDARQALARLNRAGGDPTQGITKVYAPAGPASTRRRRSGNQRHNPARSS